MRKTISMLMIFVFGASLWADQNVQKAKSENQRPKIFSERISTSIRLELNPIPLYGRFIW